MWRQIRHRVSQEGIRHVDEFFRVQILQRGWGGNFISDQILNVRRTRGANKLLKTRGRAEVRERESICAYVCVRSGGQC